MNVLSQAYAAIEAGDRPLARTQLLAVLQELPDHAEALSLASGFTDDPVTALALASAACRREPGAAFVWYNRALAEHGMGNVVGAMDCYRRVLRLAPYDRGALVNAAELIRVNEFFDEALEIALRLEEVAPDSHLGYHNAAVCLAHLERHEEADAHFEKAIALAPDPSLSRWEQHHSLLRRARFAEAWDAYAVRFRCGHLVGVEDMALDRPRWDGELLEGRHILLYGEQGLGDHIMFACAIEQLLALAGRVSLLVAAPLVKLFAASFPRIEVLAISNGQDKAQCDAALAQCDAVQRVDYVLPLGSLMGIYRTQPANFTGVPYLRPSHEARSWAEALESGAIARHVPESGRRKNRRGAKTQLSQGHAPLRIGVCWATNPALHRDFSARRARHKTMALAEMLPVISAPGVAATSLSNVPLDAFAGADRARQAGLADMSSHLADLDRTAALIECLDLVITVDTAVAHLAGSLGKPTWLLLHSGGDPRWGMPGSRNTWWYASMRLFWQAQPGDWSGLIAEVRSELDRTTSGRS